VYNTTILSSVQQLQHIPIEMGAPIVSCSIADPYILIMSDEGMLMMLTLKQEASGARLVLTKPLIANVSLFFDAPEAGGHSGCFVRLGDRPTVFSAVDYYNHIYYCVRFQNL